MKTTQHRNNSRKKWLILAAAAMSLASLAVAAGCKSEPEYYKLMYSMPRGITLVCRHEDGRVLESGTEIREGYRVNFSIVQDKFCSGNPVVRVNGQIMQAENGVYSFVMQKNSAIIVDPSSVSYTPHYTVEFSKGVDDRIWYEYNGRQVEGGFKEEFAVGETVTFKLRTSVYYTQEYEVYANTEEVQPVSGSADTYSFVCSDDTVISVYGLRLGEDFYGKLQDPYLAAADELDIAYSEAVDNKGEAVSTDYKNYVSAETKYKDARRAYDGASSEEVKSAQQAIMTAQQAIMQEIEAKPDMAALVAKRKNYVAKREVLEAAGKSEENPFLIENAVDLYAMASYINNSFNVGYGFQTAYYKLKNNIDLNGEQLYIIGDGVNGSAVFCGRFDGGGHTISNFFINDYVIDQEDYVNLYLPYIGMFGFVAAAKGEKAPSIKNLKLDRFTVDIDAGKHISEEGYSSLHVGTLVGAAMGATITGCSSANAGVRVSGNNQVFCSVGGLIGYIETLSTDNAKDPSVIASCATDVSIECANRVWAAGGILGYAITADPTVNVSVVNSYSKGKVSGAVNAGGIVGHLNDNTSVTNCYSAGDVVAYSNYLASGGASSDEFCYANAGGIVGFAEANTVIANCFSLGRTTSIAVEGAKYHRAGAVYGGTVDDGAGYADARRVVVVNCERNGSLADSAYIQNTLGWKNVSCWKFTGSYPELDIFADVTSFTVSISSDESVQEGKTSVEADSYRAMAYWYGLNRENAAAGLSEYLTAANGKRTYAYFFDPAGTQRVPLSYVPTANVTLYAKFSDYNAVKGTYYFKNRNGAYLTLSENGKFFFTTGALTENGIYTYNGVTGEIMLLNSCLAQLSTNADFYYAAFKAELAGGVLTITEPVFFPAGSELVALVADGGFTCGDYYDTNGNEYHFFENGNGVRVIGQSTTAFTYEVSGDIFSLQLSGGIKLNGTLENSVPQTLNGLGLQTFDAFKGVWKKQVTTLEEYSFNGKFVSDSEGGRGSWTYRRYTVDADGKRKLDESATKTGSYVIDASTLTATGGMSFTAVFEEGLLVITKDAKTNVFGSEEGYIGIWRFPNQTEPVKLELKGLNKKGVGEAILTFESSDSQPYKLRYEVVTAGGASTVYLYRGSIGFGALKFCESKFNAATGTYEALGTLEGELYSEKLGAIREGSVALFYLEDNFSGRWEGEADDFFTSVTFNGKGYYNLQRSVSHMAIAGNVAVSSKDGRTYNVAYSLTQGTEAGTFTLSLIEVKNIEDYDPEDGVDSSHQESVIYRVKYSVSFNDGGEVVLTYIEGYDGERTDVRGSHILHRA